MKPMIGFTLSGAFALAAHMGIFFGLLWLADMLPGPTNRIIQFACALAAFGAYGTLCMLSERLWPNRFSAKGSDAIAFAILFAGMQPCDAVFGKKCRDRLGIKDWDTAAIVICAVSLYLVVFYTAFIWTQSWGQAAWAALSCIVIQSWFGLISSTLGLLGKKRAL